MHIYAPLYLHTVISIESNDCLASKSEQKSGHVYFLNDIQLACPFMDFLIRQSAEVLLSPSVLARKYTVSSGC